MKEVIFHKQALAVLRTLPRGIKRELGKATRDLQRGQVLQMPLSRPMPSVALGVAELRVRDSSGNYRVLYYLKNRRGILVFHIFMKKTQKSSCHDMILAR
jgi:phage-related protein